MRLIVAVDDGFAIAEGLRREGHEVLAVVMASALALAAGDRMRGEDAEFLLRAIADAGAVVLSISTQTITADVVALCDRAGTRIVPLCDDAAGERIAAVFGLESPVPADAEPWHLSDVLSSAPGRTPVRAGTPERVERVLAVDLEERRPDVLADLDAVALRGTRAMREERSLGGAELCAIMRTIGVHEGFRGSRVRPR